MRRGELQFKKLNLFMDPKQRVNLPTTIIVD